MSTFKSVHLLCQSVHKTSKVFKTPLKQQNAQKRNNNNNTNEKKPN